MKAVVQRVRDAAVTVAAERVGEIGRGLLVYVGVERGDTDQDVRYLAEKIRYLRAFPDERDLMNRDVVQAGAGVLVVSAFSTAAETGKGRRPSFDRAAPPEEAEPRIAAVCTLLKEFGLKVEQGRFRADMLVTSTNEGPVCLLLESRRRE